MKLEHSFTEYQRAIFLYHYNCFICGRSDRGIEIHHVCGRKKNEKYLDSTFNMSLLCMVCHNAIQHDFETRIYLFKSTISILKQERYAVKEIDVLFLNEHSKDKYGKTVQEMIDLM